MSRLAICPGTYDPITLGHIDIVRRAAKIFDEVLVAVTIGSTRKKTLFTADERIDLASRSLADLGNVRVEGFNCLVSDLAIQKKAVAFVKGLRAISDFDYEFQMAQFNRRLAEDVETVYLPASPEYSFISSSGVREIAAWGGAVEDYVPAHVADALRQRRMPDGGAAS